MRCYPGSRGKHSHFNASTNRSYVGISARAMQRFLTEARWDDAAVIGRLQEYLAPRLAHPEAVWVLDGSDFPKQGRKSVGVARQYCGRLGKVANLSLITRPSGQLSGSRTCCRADEYPKPFPHTSLTAW